MSTGVIKVEIVNLPRTTLARAYYFPNYVNLSL
jgi:hypothetical protein